MLQNKQHLNNRAYRTEKLIQVEIVDKEQLDMIAWRFYKLMHILLTSKNKSNIDWMVEF